VAQKARREVEAKVRKEAKRRMVAEEKKKKKRTLEYLQQLWDKVLKKKATLLESADVKFTNGRLRFSLFYFSFSFSSHFIFLFFYF